MTQPPQYPGYPSPYTPPPVAPPPNPPSRRRGLFLGGLVIGATLAAVAVILLLTGVFPVGGDSGDPDPDATTAAASGDRYAAPSGDPCEGLDLSGFEAVLPSTAPATKSDYETNSGAEASWQCTADFADTATATGELSVVVHVYDTESQAKRQFTSNEKLGELKWTDSDDITEEKAAEGDWDKGVTAFAADDTAETSQQTIVYDGNVYLDVYFKVRGAARGNSDEAALTELESTLIEQALSDMKAKNR